MGDPGDDVRLATAAFAEGAPEAGPVRCRRGYLSRHWRGDLGLGTSYWVNGVLVSVALSLGGLALGFAIASFRVSPVALASTLSMVALLCFGLSVWQGVGIWRSARQHVARGGKRVWAVTTKLVVVVGLVRLGFVLATQEIPIVRSAWAYAAALASLPAPAAHGLRRGTEVEFAGAIRPGAAAVLQRGFDVAPGVRVLHLDSPGGDLAEATEMAAAVRRRGLTTYVRGQCLSACTVVFHAGRERVLRDGAALGFHRPWTMFGDAGAVRGIMAAERARMAGTHLPAWFIERVLATPAVEMWFPTDAELSLAGILTRRSDGEEFSPGRPRSPVGAVDMTGILRGQPMAAALERGDPVAFNGLVEEVLDLAKDGGTRGDLVVAVQRAALSLYAAGLQAAPDTELVAAVRAALPAAEALARSDPQRCKDWLFARQGRPLPDVTRLLDAETAGALATAAAAVMDAASTARAASRLAPTDPVYADWGRRPLLAMGAATDVRLWQFQATASDGPAKTGDEATRVCLATIWSFQDALLLPEAAPALRRILRQGRGRPPRTSAQ